MLAWAIDLKREVVKRSFGDKGPTLKWWRGFRDGHKELSLRKVEAIDRGRAANAKEDIIQEYFDVLEDTMRKNNLLDKSHLLFNYDESALVLNKLAKRVLVPRKSKLCRTTDGRMVKVERIGNMDRLSVQQKSRYQSS